MANVNGNVKINFFDKGGDARKGEKIDTEARTVLNEWQVY